MLKGWPDTFYQKLQSALFCQRLTNVKISVNCNHNMINVIELGKDFFFGGNATFTIKSERTNEHRTFKIRKTKPTPRFPTPACFVSLLTGSNNETDFTYLGLVDEKTGFFRLTKNSKHNESSPDIVILKWFLRHLFSDMTLQNATINHTGRCGCCGRLLTVPESVTRGIGPECWSRICGA